MAWRNWSCLWNCLGIGRHCRHCLFRQALNWASCSFVSWCFLGLWHWSRLSTLLCLCLCCICRQTFIDLLPELLTLLMLCTFFIASIPTILCFIGSLGFFLRRAISRIFWAGSSSRIWPGCTSRTSWVDMCSSIITSILLVTFPLCTCPPPALVLVFEVLFGSITSWSFLLGCCVKTYINKPGWWVSP